VDNWPCTEEAALSRAGVAAGMEIAADSVQEALGAELVPVEKGDDGNRGQYQRPQRFFLGSQAQVPAGKQRQRHGAYQDAYTDFERTVHVEYKARPGDAGDKAWTRSKHSDALPSSFFGRNDECQGTIDERTQAGVAARADEVGNGRTDVKKNFQERGPDDTETYRNDPEYCHSSRTKPQQPNEHHCREGQYNRSVTEIG
jgi:hypothetical protein